MGCGVAEEEEEEKKNRRERDFFLLVFLPPLFFLLPHFFPLSAFFFGMFLSLTGTREEWGKSGEREREREFYGTK